MKLNQEQTLHAFGMAGWLALFLASTPALAHASAARRHQEAST